METLRILNQEDLVEIFPFGKTKVYELIRRRIIPVTKIGKDYIISEERLKKWLEEQEGLDIDF